MSYRINVRNCKAVPVTTNSSSSYSLGDSIALPDLDTIEIAFLTATGELYGDGKLVDKSAEITGAQLKLGIDKVAQAARAALGGHTIDSNGVLRVATSDKAPEIAVYMETESTGTDYEAIWLLCGKCEPIGLTGKQKESAVTYSTDSLTINCVARKLDNQVLALADTENSTFNAEKQTKFKAHPDLSA